jgi:hypothetical protein
MAPQLIEPTQLVRSQGQRLVPLRANTVCHCQRRHAAGVHLQRATQVKQLHWRPVDPAQYQLDRRPPFRAQRECTEVVLQRHALHKGQLRALQQSQLRMDLHHRQGQLTPQLDLLGG